MKDVFKSNHLDLFVLVGQSSILFLGDGALFKLPIYLKKHWFVGG